MFLFQPLSLQSRAVDAPTAKCKAVRLTPPQAARYANEATRHRSCVAELTYTVSLLDAALLTLYDGSSNSISTPGSPHRHCSSSRLEVTDGVQEAWRRLPCPP